jgi:hypothetical protein
VADKPSGEITGPSIVESYRDFEPPRGFKKKVEILLQYVPPKFLAGLEAIILTNGAALNRNGRRQKTWSRNHKVQISKCLGLYRGKTRSTSAAVWLYVDNIKKAGMGPLDSVPVFRYFAVGNVLYHEIGHHIHTVHRPKNKEKEDVADDWGRGLFKNFLRKRFWYVFPLLTGLAGAALWIGKKTGLDDPSSAKGRR